MNQNLIIELKPEILAKERDKLERFLSVITAMEFYSLDELKKIQDIEKKYKGIEQKYISKLSFNLKDIIDRLTESITYNQNFLNYVIKIYKPQPSFYEGIYNDYLEIMRYEEGTYIYDIFKFILRDWTIENKKEREETYGTIINEVVKYFPSNIEDSINYKFLIPGSGLNRLGYELCKYGFDIECNDYLFINGIFTDIIFNHSKKNEFSICPNINTFDNYFDEESIFRKYSFPDIDVNIKNLPGKLKISIGNFIILYDKIKDLYDCIITCFFLDSNPNMLEYIEVISNILKKGGIWINFGPLSYYWPKSDKRISIELPYDKLKEVICNYGFKFINESFKKTTFCYNENKMHNILFKCINFTVKKI